VRSQGYAIEWRGSEVIKLAVRSWCDHT